jgi:cell division protease FtsH
MTLPEKDRNNYSRKWSLSYIKMGLGGRIAEEMFTGDINTGAGGDIRMVTNIARAMVRDWGMNDRVGFVFYGEDENRNPYGMGGGREYSEETARVIDEEVKKLIDRLEVEAKQMLDQYKDRVEAVARALIKYETIDANDVERIMRGDMLTRPSVSEMIDSPQPRRAVVVTPPENPGLPPGAIPAPG